METKKDYNAIGHLTIEEVSPELLKDIKDIAVEVAGIEEAGTTSFDASKYKQGHIMYLVDDVQEAIDKLTDLVDNTASTTEDGLMSKTDKIKLDGVEAGANKYVHPSSHDASMITESSSKRFVSDTEKSTWNAKASTAVATTSANGLMLSTDKSKLDGITAGANKVEASTTNGKIKINGTETTVYTHPTGTNPHGTTKADIGLSNVDNTSDLNKPISTAVQTALNGKANSSHTHTSANISDATNANTANMIVKRDSSGNFSAGTITASLSGNASTATKWATARTLTLTGGVTGSASIDGSGNVSLATTLAAHNQASNTITAMTGYAKASAVSAITTTDTLNSAIGKLEKALDSKQASGSYASSSHTHNYAGSSSAGGSATSALTCTGNSATATKLQTARTINGTSFDGSANITTANWGTARTLTIGNTGKSVNGSGNVSWSLSEIGASSVSDAVQRWTCTVTCAKWSRIMFLSGNSVVGHSGILNIQGTRANVVYNATFIINTSHSNKGYITQLNNTDYSNFKIRTLVATNGETYIEVYENSNSATSTTTQNLNISYISLSGAGAGNITKYTSFTDGTTLPSGYTVTSTVTTVSGGIIANKQGTGENSVILGDLDNNVASGKWSFAQGRMCTASGLYANATGNSVKATGDCSHAEGQSTTASGNYSHAEGQSTTASGQSAHAEGNYTFALGYYSHAEGQSTYAYNTGCHAEGYKCIAGDSSSSISAVYPSHAEGYSTKATGQVSHAEGYTTTASGKYSHAEGYSTTASGESSHAQGQSTTASGKGSHAEGISNVASGYASHAQGDRSTASGDTSHASGLLTTASGSYSVSEGIYSTAETYGIHVMGRYNKVNSGSATSYNATQNAFVIGNGSSSSSKSNCFRVVYNGSVYGLSAFNSSGADYAEYFEWLDGNPNNEDRIGLFVTLDGEKIRLANSEDHYILGIISGNQSIIGNACEDSWNDMYIKDRFDRLQYEDVEVEKENHIIDEETGEAEIITEKVIEKRIKQNPNYDPSIKYIPRSERKEWGVVGMLGQIRVIDDGTCTANGYCAVGENGIATKSDKGYRVMKRIDENLILVLFK